MKNFDLSEYIDKNKYLFCFSAWQIYRYVGNKKVIDYTIEYGVFNDLVSKGINPVIWLDNYMKLEETKYGVKYYRQPCNKIYFDSEILQDDFDLIEQYIGLWFVPCGENLLHKSIKSPKNIDLFKFKGCKPFERTNEYLNETVNFSKGLTTLKIRRKKEKFISATFESRVQSLLNSGAKKSKVVSFVRNHFSKVNKSKGIISTYSRGEAIRFINYCKGLKLD